MPNSDRSGEERTQEFVTEEMQTEELGAQQPGPEQFETEELKTEQFETEQLATGHSGTGTPEAGPFEPGAADQQTPAGSKPKRSTAEKLALPGFIIAIGAAVLATIALILSVVSVSHQSSGRHSDRGRTTWEETVDERYYDGPSDRGSRDSRRGGQFQERGQDGRFSERFEEERFTEQFEEGRRGPGRGHHRQNMFEDETVEEESTTRGTTKGDTTDEETGSTGTGSDSDA